MLTKQDFHYFSTLSLQKDCDRDAQVKGRQWLEKCKDIWWTGGQWTLNNIQSLNVPFKEQILDVAPDLSGNPSRGRGLEEGFRGKWPESQITLSGRPGCWTGGEQETSGRRPGCWTGPDWNSRPLVLIKTNVKIKFVGEGFNGMEVRLICREQHNMNLPYQDVSQGGAVHWTEEWL